MTDRRPDIHCTGCGRYCYSLSHRAGAQDFPDTHYCDTCKEAVRRGMRTSTMLDRTWMWKSGIVLERFQKKKRLSKDELETINSFRRTTGFSLKERKLVGDLNKMTAVEWKEIARERLAGLGHLRKYYTRRDIILLNAFIASAPCRGDLLPLKKKPTKRERDLNALCEVLRTFRR